jgi:hypothetical protein
VIFALSLRNPAGVEAALEEARMPGYDSVGDEDLLLGILRSDVGVVAEALSALEVTLHTARDESEEMLFSALSSIGMPLEKVRRCRRPSPNIFRALCWWQEGRINPWALSLLTFSLKRRSTDSAGKSVSIFARLDTNLITAIEVVA